MPGGASAVNEEWEIVGLDDANRNKEAESHSALSRARSITPAKGSRPVESKGQLAEERREEIFIFEGKELMRVTAQKKPVWQSNEIESKYAEKESIGSDLRDLTTHYGPCAVNHQRYYKGTNAHVSWRHCYRCRVRLYYIPTPLSLPPSTQHSCDVLSVVARFGWLTRPCASCARICSVTIASSMECAGRARRLATTTAQSMRGISALKHRKLEQIHEMRGMCATPSKRKARFATGP